jgi:hypothetical protein
MLLVWNICNLVFVFREFYKQIYICCAHHFWARRLYTGQKKNRLCPPGGLVDKILLTGILAIYWDFDVSFVVIACPLNRPLSLWNPVRLISFPQYRNVMRVQFTETTQSCVSRHLGRREQNCTSPQSPPAEYSCCAVWRSVQCSAVQCRVGYVAI